MSRRVPVQEIRGSDPTLLEVQLSEMLRRPLGQLAPENVMDLIELAGTEGRPRSLDRGLAGFVEGVARQISDIPNGRSFLEYLEETAELPGERVPHRFREILQAEMERDERTDKDRIAAVLEQWAGIEPEPFELGARKARVQRVEVRPRKRATEPSSAPRERSRRSRGRSSGGSPSGGSSTRVVVSDDGRSELVRDLVLEKLARASENGLGEAVLVAGIRHQAKDRFPDLKPTDITGVLKSLRDTHQVRYSAGRWSLPTRF